MGPAQVANQKAEFASSCPFSDSGHTINVDINTLDTRICSDVTKNSEITKCTENVVFFFHGSWKDEMGIVFFLISLQAKASSAGATKIKNFVCKLI